MTKNYVLPLPYSYTLHMYHLLNDHHNAKVCVTTLFLSSAYWL